MDCFNTQGFEKLGRGDIDQFEYDVSVARGYYDTKRFRIAIKTIPRSPTTPNEHNVADPAVELDDSREPSSRQSDWMHVVFVGRPTPSLA